MKITSNVALEVACHEGLIRQTYKDSVGVLTWCIGMTNATGHSVERYIGSPQTYQHCMNIYVWALDRYADQVRDVFKDKPLSESEFAAALSFHWNTGAIKRATWVKKWLAGDIAGARQSFMAWNKPKEIVGRRAAERDLFFDGKWSNNGTTTEYTRVTSRMTPDWGSAKRVNIAPFMDEATGAKEPEGTFVNPEPDNDVTPGTTLTPETAPKPKPWYQSRTIWGALGTFVTTLATTLTDLFNALHPAVAVALILVAAGFAAWIIRERRLKAAEFGA